MTLDSAPTLWYNYLATMKRGFFYCPNFRDRQQSDIIVDRAAISWYRLKSPFSSSHTEMPGDAAFDFSQPNKKNASGVNAGAERICYV
jgi:hypothetical protein